MRRHQVTNGARWSHETSKSAPGVSQNNTCSANAELQLPDWDPWVGCVAAQSQRSRPGTTLCASLHSRNARENFTRTTFYNNLQVECRQPEPRPTLCESLRARNTILHFTRATLRENFQEKCPSQEVRRRLYASLRSRNALGRFTIEPSYAEICRKNARAQMEHADQAPA